MAGSQPASLAESQGLGASEQRQEGPKATEVQTHGGVGGRGENQRLFRAGDRREL